MARISAPRHAPARRSPPVGVPRRRDARTCGGAASEGPDACFSAKIEKNRISKIFPPSARRPRRPPRTAVSGVILRAQRYPLPRPAPPAEPPNRPPPRPFNSQLEPEPRFWIYIGGDHVSLPTPPPKTGPFGSPPGSVRDAPPGLPRRPRRPPPGLRRPSRGLGGPAHGAPGLGRGWPRKRGRRFFGLRAAFWVWFGLGCACAVRAGASPLARRAAAPLRPPSRPSRRWLLLPAGGAAGWRGWGVLPFPPPLSLSLSSLSLSGEGGGRGARGHRRKGLGGNGVLLLACSRSRARLWCSAGPSLGSIGRRTTTTTTWRAGCGVLGGSRRSRGGARGGGGVRACVRALPSLSLAPPSAALSPPALRRPPPLRGRWC